MKYEVINASKKDEELIKKIKIETILNGNDLTEEEINRIKEYVNNNTIIENYKLIIIDNEIAGLYCISDYELGIMLEEIYIFDKYRKKGIATEIINNIKKEKVPIYLWVYKTNENAYNLYKKLDFHKIKETNNRYLMEYIEK